ncbi:MAG: TrmH family RNA methyltransferase [Candidatus Pacebacteria bacterium]|nr:TrmH family RNA methyltransferase [Candidatus Paceibacterota bacterium]
MKKIFLILHNIRSLHNVGSIFRTADTAGVSKMYLTGYTPAPLDIFGKTRKEIVKTALGAEKYVAWEKQKNIGRLIIKLKNNGVFVSAVEQSKNSIDYREFGSVRADRIKFPAALILGNEVRGLSEQILKKCDAVIEIPVKGKMVRQAGHPKNRSLRQRRGKESLNVAVAAGIILFKILEN